MKKPIRKHAKILIIDDEISNVRYLEMILQDEGYLLVRSTTDSRQALELYREFSPDLLLLDLHMPYLTGYEVMQQLGQLQGVHNYLPILVLTADATTESKVRALAEGAHDFLSKPFDAVEGLQRISNMLETRFHNEVLQEEVRVRTRELQQSETETAKCLASAGEFRDDDTGHHTQRVGAMSAAIARCYGLPEQRAVAISHAAPLHDVGKIGIADQILLKPGKLTLEEFVTMRTHTTIGAGILAQHHTPLLQLAANIALSHHERWDGTGYPQRLKGDSIPIEGRIVAVADVLDALSHARPYKSAWSEVDAKAEIVRQSGTQFDPDVVAAFIKANV